MERLPIEYGDVVPASARREELHRRYARVRRANVQGAQNGAIRLQSVFQVFARGMSVKYCVR